MSGWIALLLLIALRLATLWLLRSTWSDAAVAPPRLLFGAAGYAVFGSARPGIAVRSAEERQPPIPLTNLRHAFFGRFGRPSIGWSSRNPREPGQDAGGGRRSADRRSGSIPASRNCGSVSAMRWPTMPER